jgi:hypothetical protein
MASLQWDRLLETCHRHGAGDLLLTPGSPPMIHLHEGWRALHTPAIDVGAVRTLADDRLGATPDAEVDGYAYSDFRYGEAGMFRAMAFGFPNTTVLLVTRFRSDPDGEQPQETPL